MTMKRCSRCGREFPATAEFFHSHTTKDGFRHECKVCRAAYTKVWRERNASQPAARTHKTCPMCKQTLEVNESNFSRQRGSLDGFFAVCRPCRSAHRKSQYNETRDAVNASRRLRYKQRLPVFRAQRKAQYAREREEAIRKAREWRENNPERYRATQQEYGRRHFQANKDRYRVYVRNRRARLAQATGSHTPEDIQHQYQLQSGRCYWCDKSLGDNYHVDHYIPLSRGGANDPSNLVVACPRCNCSRRDKLPEEWRPISD